MPSTDAMKIGDCIQAKFKAGKTAKDKSFADGWIHGVVVQANADGSYDLKWSDHTVSKKVCWKEEIAHWVTGRGNVIEAIAPDESSSPSSSSGSPASGRQVSLGLLKGQLTYHHLLQKLDACNGVHCKALVDEEESLELEVEETTSGDYFQQATSERPESTNHQAQVDFQQHAKSKWNLWTAGWTASWSQPAVVRQEDVSVFEDSSACVKKVSGKVVHFDDDIEICPITPVRDVFLHDVTPTMRPVMVA